MSLNDVLSQPMKTTGYEAQERLNCPAKDNGLELSYGEDRLHSFLQKYEAERRKQEKRFSNFLRSYENERNRHEENFRRFLRTYEEQRNRNSHKNDTRVITKKNDHFKEPRPVNIHIVDMVEDPEKVLEQMRPQLQWNVGADCLFKELQHCLTPEIQKTIKEQIKHEGNQVAVETILNQLLCEDDWPSQLYRALLSPSINRPKLARKLKGSKMEEDSKKELDQSRSSMGDGDSVQLGAQKKFVRCTGKTKVKNLPMTFLRTLKQNLDIEDGWKLLAVQLGYDVAYIDPKNGSPTEHLILHWINKDPDADIETILSSLHKMEYKSLSKELREICEHTFDSVDGASSNLVKDESPILIPDFNPVPDLHPSINESLKKGDYVSPTISPMIPRKAIITKMDMPKYSESYDQDCNTSTSVRSKSASEKKIESLDLFDFNTYKDTTVPLIESPSSLGPPLSTLSSESLNDSSTSGISKSSQHSETSLCLECYSADVTKPQMADSGFMECVDVKNQDLIEHSSDLAALGKNSLLLGSTSNDNIVSESTSKSKYDLSETAATPVKCYEHGDLSFEQIQISDPESYSVHFHSEENDKIGNEPEIESADTETVLESEVKTAKMFIENILESALTQHFATEDPSISFEPEIISSALEGSAENIAIEETEADSLVHYALDDKSFEPEIISSALEGSAENIAIEETEADSLVHYALDDKSFEPEIISSALEGSAENIAIEETEADSLVHYALDDKSFEPEIISSALEGSAENIAIEETEADSLVHYALDDKSFEPEIISSALEGSAENIAIEETEADSLVHYALDDKSFEPEIISSALEGSAENIAIEETEADSLVHYALDDKSFEPEIISSALEGSAENIAIEETEADSLVHYALDDKSFEPEIISSALEGSAENIAIEETEADSLVHYALDDKSFEPEIISSALEGSAENIAIEETEADSLVHYALDDEVVVLSKARVQNDFGIVSQEPKPLLTAVTFLENDATITQREGPVTLSEDDNITELSEEEAIIEATEIVSKDVAPPEIEAEMTESITKQGISEDTNVSQSENNSEMAVLKAALQDTKKRITKEVSSKMAENSNTASDTESDTNSGSLPNIPALESTEISLSETDIEPDTKHLKTEVVVSDDTLDRAASASLSKIITSSSVKETINSDTVVSDVNRMKETINSDVVPDILASEILTDIHTSFPISETEILDTEQVSSTESLSEVQSDMGVLNIAELATPMSISDTVTSKTVSEESSTCIMKLEDSIIAAELETSVILPNIAMANTVPEVTPLITLPEIKENTVQELQATRTMPEINLEVKLKDSLESVEIPEAKTAVKEDNGGVKEAKEIGMELSPQAVEVSLSSKDSDTIPLYGISLQQYISNVDQISSEEKVEKSSAKPRFTYHYFGYIVLGMAMVGSGMLFLHKYWK